MEWLTNLTKPVETGINVVTLGLYGDISSMFTGSETTTEMQVVAAILTVVKWILLFMALYFISRWICRRIKLTNFVVLAVTIIAVALICVFYNNPMNDYEVISMRLSSLAEAMSTNITFKPDIVSVMSGVNLTGYIDERIPRNITVPVFTSSGGVPTITMQNADVSWLRVVIYLLIILVALIVITKVSRVLGGLIAVLGIGAILNFSNDVMVTILLSLILIVVVSTIIFRFSRNRFVIAYPIGLLVVLACYLIQPPSSILIPLLILALLLMLFPVFYLFGALIYMLGEVVEGREKLGMKVKPKRVVEEKVGRWDPVAVGIVLTSLFTLILVLYGVSIQGLGVFLTTSFGLLRG